MSARPTAKGIDVFGVYGRLGEEVKAIVLCCHCESEMIERLFMERDKQHTVSTNCRYFAGKRSLKTMLWQLCAFQCGKTRCSECRTCPGRVFEPRASQNEMKIAPTTERISTVCVPPTATRSVASSVWQGLNAWMCVGWSNWRSIVW